tara:strand:+ start:5105 stop:5278 length:174 start_codon:yes stop_codon:yes gene_type:complete
VQKYQVTVKVFITVEAINAFDASHKGLDRVSCSAKKWYMDVDQVKSVRDVPNTNEEK